MSLLRHLPNALTCCNLLCGCLGLMILMENDHGHEFLDFCNLVPWLVWIACVFDFLDGFAARMLKFSSPIGKELDSLADMVTFGVLPVFYLVHYYNSDVLTGDLSLICLTLVVCSALRLAKFNVDTRQTDGFIGVPTPANALFFTALPMALDYFPIQPSAYFLIGIILLFSWLMVSPLRLFALKFKHFKWKGNELRFTFLLASVLLIAIFQYAGITLIIILYILASLVTNWRPQNATPSH